MPFQQGVQRLTAGSGRVGLPGVLKLQKVGFRVYGFGMVCFFFWGGVLCFKHII